MSAEPMSESVRVEYLRAIGVDVWQTRAAPAAAALPDSAGTSAADAAVHAAGREEAPATQASTETPVKADDWALLQHEVGRCTRCRLHETRIQPVFGVGDRHAKLMIIGEAPGAEEDRSGEPFVGRAGQMLTAMLKGIGIAREQVFITNTLKCRPPQNRDPRVDETASCNEYLLRQIAAVRPAAILAVGRIAAQQLLELDLPLGRMRGSEHSFGDDAIPVVVTYHPAYLLRTPSQKALAWQDLKRAKIVLDAVA